MCKNFSKEKDLFFYKASEIADKLLKEEAVHEEFTCPICGKNVVVLRYNKEEYKGDYLVYCKGCNNRGMGRIFL